MTTSSPSSDPPAGLGLISVILGSVGGVLFFLPVLGIPLSIAGLLLGLMGFLLALLARWSSLRWSVVGIVVSAVALGIGIAIGQAPASFPPSPKGPSFEQNETGPIYVPPPARPGE
jgi:hypothetical protein